MPIYEYKCGNCHDTFEVLQKFNDEPLAECVNCHQGPVKKLMSVSSFVLKGAGFYVNDYKKPTADKDNSGKSSTTASDTTASSTTASDTTASSTTASSTTASSSTSTSKD